jgi:hypothetical protein
VQRAERRAGCALLVGFPRGFPDAIGFERYECPEIGTQGSASEQRIREALGSNLAVADRLGRLGNT